MSTTAFGKVSYSSFLLSLVGARVWKGSGLVWALQTFLQTGFVRRKKKREKKGSSNCYLAKENDDRYKCRAKDLKTSAKHIASIVQIVGIYWRL